MKTLKIGIKKDTDILFYGEPYMITHEYWTTVKGEDRFDMVCEGMENLKKQIAVNEYFTHKNIKVWKRLTILREDIMVNEID